MKFLSMFAVVLALGLGFGAEAEAAKRLGSGGSSGMQRQMTPPAKAPDAAPAARLATPTAAAAPAAATAGAAAAAKPARSWLGPVAGLAAGLGLAALASHFGFGEELASMMLMALIAMAVLAAVAYFMRKRAAGQQAALAGAAAGAGNARFANTAKASPADNALNPLDTVARREAYSGDAGVRGAGSTGSMGTLANSANVPADFDVAGFVRNAKVHYIRLQAANDAGNLNDIREFTTPEMFAEIKLTIAERAGQAQATDVIAIDAEVLDVTEEADRYIVSTRFTGQIREDNGPVDDVDEIWHLVKPRHGQGGWLLAGIQQVQ